MDDEGAVVKRVVDEIEDAGAVDLHVRKVNVGDVEQGVGEVDWRLVGALATDNLIRDAVRQVAPELSRQVEPMP